MQPTWKDHASLRNARRDFGLVCYKNTLIAVGGRENPERDIVVAHSISANKPLYSVETFDTTNPYAKWNELTSQLRVGRSGLALLVVGNTIRMFSLKHLRKRLLHLRKHWHITNEQKYRTNSRQGSLEEENSENVIH